jgi:protein-tyrosine phosphatase/arsenate reductase
MIPLIKTFCDNLTKEFETIPDNRKEILAKITEYIATKMKENKPINLVYICTHNSRRSHFGQVWAHVAASYYGIKNVNTYSGGTEATAFNSNAISALKRIGFNIKAIDTDKNTRYRVFHDDKESPSVCFSKTYDAATNPQKEFAAIMTCSDAEENCPFIPGVELRIATTYDERCKQIALETLYAFSLVK